MSDANHNLTANVSGKMLDEVKVMGKTVYISHSTEKAYVEFQGELVSMTNLRAWNQLMEKAKEKAIDGYEGEKTFEEKEMDRRVERISNMMRDMGRELQEEAYHLKDSIEEDQ